MINNSILNMENQRKHICIYNIFRVILILSLSILLINNCLADNEDSKKCVIYKDGKLMYNPDNPKIHCTTLQILDNYWEENNVNIPNQNKKPEEFAEMLTEKEVISNGKTVCKNPSASNAKFTAKEALEDETISGTCNTGFTGTVSATCKKSGSWDINNNCSSDCNNLENMYTDSSFINTIKTISNDEFAYSKCKLGYSGYIKHKCSNGIIGETENLCILNTNYCQKLTNIENGSITYNNNQAINSIATLKCNTGYELDGNKSTVCNVDSEASGKWSTTFGSCNPRVCSNPTTQTNANAFTKTSLKYNEAAITATCKTGYTGTITATCEANGNWKYNGNCSIVRCPTSLTVANGSYTAITTANNSYNTKITGKCNTGYTGTITATCDASGKWVKSGNCSVISGCTEFAFHNSQQYLNVPSTGLANIKVQVWGAQGGNGKFGSGGAGGYGYGELSSISGNTKINVIVGQWGGTYNTSGPSRATPYGAGYGGYVNGLCGKTGKGGAGGGGTKVWFDSTILQAGGGGGGAENYLNGGAGGGANKSGNDGSANGGNNSVTWNGKGGTLSGAGVAYGGQWCGSASGGNGGWAGSDSSDSKWWCGGAGGGGYYGGSGGSYGQNEYASGGGGSGYAKGFNNVIGTNGAKTGNGFVRICWGNNTACDGGSSDNSKSVCSVTYSNANSNAVEIHYGNKGWTSGFIRYGTSAVCDTATFGSDPSYGDTKRCASPGGYHTYASEHNSFTAY